MKRFFAICMAGVLAAGLLVGCSETPKKENQEPASNYVTLGTYKSLEIAKQDMGEVTQEDVDSQINSLLLSNAEEVEADRPAENGDTVVIDFVGYMDGEKFDGGSGENYDLTLGSGSFIDDFEEQLIGYSAGDKVEVNVTFPDGYGNGFDNKDAMFEVTIHKVLEYVTPEYTDEFVASNTNYDNIGDYEAAVKEQLQAQLEDTEEQNRRAAVLAALVENAEFKELPEDELKKYQEQLDQYYASLAEAYGVDLNTLISYTGNTTEEFNAYLEETAIAMTKQHMALLAVAEKEGIAVSEEEYKAGLAQYAEDYAVTEEEMLDYYSEQEIRDLILTEEVVQWLISNSVEK